MQVAKGTVGVWNGTAIKLFRVENVAAQGPTLSSPRGAVDAVGSNIVSRIGSINLRGAGTGTQAATAPQGIGGGGDGSNSGGGNARRSVTRTGTGPGPGPTERSAIV